jgi:opacity protein-like surface antigen
MRSRRDKVVFGARELRRNSLKTSHNSLMYKRLLQDPFLLFVIHLTAHWRKHYHCIMFAPGLCIFGALVSAKKFVARSGMLRFFRFALASCSLLCFAQNWELGAGAGYGFYRNGTVYAPAGTVTAGIRNRFAITSWLTEDMYQNLSGEFRYTYQDGDPFLQRASVQTNIQGQSHAFHYDLLFHLHPRESRFRPYFAAGLGVKHYVVSGPAPPAQPFASVAQLVSTDDTEFLTAVGAGFVYRLRPNIVLRVDFRDYITKFPKKIIVAAPNGTPSGIFQQFTPMIGLAYAFGK